MADNRVTLDASGNIVLSARDTNPEAHERLINKLKGLLGQVGMQHRYTWGR